MANKFPLILNTSANQIQELASGDNLDLTGSGIHNAGVITATSFSGNITGAVTGNADTATEATNVNVTANNSTNETVYPIFVDGATGTQGAESDTGLTYNPSSGNLTATRLTGTVMVAAQPNITSVGTLSTLDVSGNVSIGGTLTYEDVTNIDSVGIITARDGLKVLAGGANVVGVVTASAGITVSAGTATFQGAIDANSDLDVDGHTNLDNVSIAGVSTFTGGVNVQGLDVNGTLDVDGHTNLDNVSIAGVVTATTFVGNGDFVELDVDGHTNLDNVSIAGIVTISGTAPNLLFTETDANPDWGILCSGGQMKFQDMTATANIFTLDDDKIQAVKNLDALAGVDVTGNLTVNGDVKFANQSIDNAVNWGKVSNTLQVRNDTKLTFGNSNQLSIYQDAASSGHSLIKGTGYVRIAAESYLQLGNAATPAMFFNCDASTGSVYIAHNGNDKIQTTNTGAVITGICTATSFSGPLKEGDTEVSVNDTGSNGEITLKANNLNVLKAISLGTNYGAIGINQFNYRHSAVSIAHTGTSTPDPNISLTSPTVQVGGGTGIFMKSSNDISMQKRYGTWIQSVRSTNDNGSPEFIIMKENAAANGLSEHFRIDKNGQVLPGADNTQNLGSSTKRWANIYSADLQLSNEGKTNDVDGTWGNYTIQEGESELFLINNRSGKKYKFNLTEVN